MPQVRPPLALTMPDFPLLSFWGKSRYRISLRSSRKTWATAGAPISNSSDQRSGSALGTLLRRWSRFWRYRARGWVQWLLKSLADQLRIQRESFRARRVGRRALAIQKRRKFWTGSKKFVVAGAPFALEHSNLTEGKTTSVALVWNKPGGRRCSMC